MIKTTDNVLFKKYCKLMDLSVTSEYRKLIENSFEYQLYKLKHYLNEFLKTIKNPLKRS